MGISCHHWAALAGWMPTSRSKRCTGTEIGSVKGARQTLRTAKIFEHERLEAHQVANVRVPKLQVKQNDV